MKALFLVMLFFVTSAKAQQIQDHFIGYYLDEVTSFRGFGSVQEIRKFMNDTTLCVRYLFQDTVFNDSDGVSINHVRNYEQWFIFNSKNQCFSVALLIDDLKRLPGYIWMCNHEYNPVDENTWEISTELLDKSTRDTEVKLAIFTDYFLLMQSIKRK